MTKDQWEKFVTDELTKLAPNTQAMKGWIVSQGFKVDTEVQTPWRLSAEHPNMTFPKLTVRWDKSKTPALSVSVS
jgi:hypothetical protein